MFICTMHHRMVVVGDSSHHKCPLCEKEKEFNKLEEQFDELEKENAGLKDDLARYIQYD